MAFAVTWLACVGYLWLGFDAGWIPHDEGTLAHSAERVLDGELPHRDFDEIYTGGLSFLNAIALRVMGRSLVSIRILFLVFASGFVAVLYFLARRFWAPAPASLVTLAGVSLSIGQLDGWVWVRPDR